MNENQTTSPTTTEENACSRQTAASSTEREPVSTENIEAQRPDIEQMLEQCLTSDDEEPQTEAGADDNATDSPADLPADPDCDKVDTACANADEEDGSVAFPPFPKRSEEAAAAAIYTALQTAAADTAEQDGQASPLFEDIDSAEYTDDAPDNPSFDATAPAAATAAAKKKKRCWPLILLVCLLAVIFGYMLVIYLPSGPIAGMRDLYIQTAMSTADHQWLATAIFPDWVIDRAWSDPNVRPNDAPENIDGLETVGTDTELHPTTEPVDPPTTTTDAVTEPPTTETTAPEHTEPPTPENDILGLSSLKVGGTDYAGNKVLVADKEEGLFISEFSGRSQMIPILKYHGYVMVIDDPSRVFVGSTPEKDETGYRILDMMDHYGDVVAGINASGFADPNDQGAGNAIIGACMSEGQQWGSFTDQMVSVVMTKENQLRVGWLPNWSGYTNIRDGMQFGPELVRNGKNMINEETGGGMGMQPRTAIGQREDGAIIMIVIDGRVSSSDGCTLWEMADMMVRYGAVTAGGCDGGSSVVLAYDGEVLNDNSSANPKYGRRIPNAFLVRSKKATENDD